MPSFQGIVPMSDREDFCFLSFSSGSSGNCYYFGDGKDGLLIDAGVSPRRIVRTLRACGLPENCFSALLVTHDHYDHVKFLDALCKCFSVPAFAPEALCTALFRHSYPLSHFASCRRAVQVGPSFEVPLFRAMAFEVPHDASYTVGYFLEGLGHRALLVTDCGRMPQEAVELGMTADTLVIESNYDPLMLEAGPYPPELKSRIRSGFGHMSNGECGEALSRMYHPQLRNVFLCHLSENNNTPMEAYAAASSALEGLAPAGSVAVRVLPRRSPTPLFRL